MAAPLQGSVSAARGPRVLPRGLEVEGDPQSPRVSWQLVARWRSEDSKGHARDGPVPLFAFFSMLLAPQCKG